MNRKKFNRRVHVSWHIAFYSCGILAGIALSARLAGSYGFNAELLIFSVLLMFVSLVKRRLPMLFLALAAGVLFGVWRGSTVRHSLAEYEPYYNQAVTVKGTIAEDTSYGTKGDQRLRLRSVQINSQSLPGILWVSTPEGADIKRGDFVVLQGTLTKGFGNLPATMYKADVTAVERPMPGDVARRVRDWFAAGIKRAIPEPESSLSVGYLVGQRSALPETLAEQLKVVGLTHAVVASGYNLTILVSNARRFFMRFSKYLAALSGFALIVSFVLITGFSPSMSRAGLVSLLGLMAWYYGRTIHPVVLLLFSAAITAVWRPAYVWGDIGWYLSFTAFTGVIVLSPLLKNYFWGKTKKFGMLRQTLLDTTSAQLLTLPIILYAFGQYATYALLANVLVLPLVPLAMLLSFLAGLGGLAVPALAQWFGWPARIILACNILVIGWVSRLPGSHGDLTFGLKPLLISYLLLLFVMVYIWKRINYDFRGNNEEAEQTGTI